MWRVPLHAFGELKIVTSCDIGELGPKEGTAVTYYWNPLYNLAGLLPWLLVAGAFIVLKENRCRQALWILLPILVFKGILYGILALLSALAGMPSEALLLFNSLADCLLVGFVVNWLLSGRIGNRNRFITWLLAWVVYAVAFGTILVSLGIGTEAIQLSIVIGITVAIFMLSFVLAGFMCRKTFGPVRFCLWMGLWVYVFTLGLFLSVALIQVASMGWEYAAMMMVSILISGSIFAGILVVALLPFEILLFVNGFWRKRFEAVFGLKKPTPVAVSETALEPES